MPKKKASADRLVVQNAAKTLLANIRFASVDNPIRVITLTSSVPNEGKRSTSRRPSPRAARASCSWSATCAAAAWPI